MEMLFSIKEHKELFIHYSQKNAVNHIQFIYQEMFEIKEMF